MPSEGLNEEAAKRYMASCLKQGAAKQNGTELNATLPKMSPLNPLYLPKKQAVLQRVAAFVERYQEIGGDL